MKIAFDGAADRLAEIIRGESNGMAHYYVALDGADQEKIAGLAAELSEKLSAFVILTDAFALPSNKLTPERQATPGGVFDYERFTREVARPFLAKQLPVYGVYAERIRGTVERVTVPERGVYLIAGRYAMHPEIPDFYDLRIAVENDGSDETASAYLSAYMIEEFCDVLLTSDPADADGEEGFSGFSLPLSFDGNA